ncbi:MAG TPA: hypothetical protein VJ695_05695 [Nitrososphaera sp.]|nr:hypothetical protein [Nitrososphaera sp.]
MRTATLPVLLGGSVIITILFILYLAEIGVVVPTISPSYATHGSHYEIQQLSDVLPADDNNSATSVKNTTMALLPNSSTFVYETEAFVAPPTVKTFVIYMANEFHERWPEESHKLITNKNAYTIPTNLQVANGTTIAFHMADAPWDTPHDYVVRVVDVNTNETVLQTTLLSYPKFNRGSSNSGITTLPIGDYRVETYLEGMHKVQTKPLTIKVTDTPVNLSSNMTAGFFYSPQRPVINPYDNDGRLHEGHLEYYRQQFPVHGLKIESIYNFHFASCSFYDKEKSPVCTDDGGTPGELYWHDNKTADHALILWSSMRPYNQIAAALDEMTWENVYT